LAEKPLDPTQLRDHTYGTRRITVVSALPATAAV